jgi:hypothetical protein
LEIKNLVSVFRAEDEFSLRVVFIETYGYPDKEDFKKVDENKII